MFSGGKLGPNMDQNCKLWYVPFSLKDISFKDCLYSVIGLSYSTSGPNFSKIAPYLGEKGLNNPPKWAILWMLHRHETI